ADALHQAGKLTLRIAADADRRVEIDDGNVGGVGQRIEELDRSGPREADVFAHAFADVQQEAEMKLRPGRTCPVARGEVAERLALPVFGNLEVLGGKIADEIPLLVRHRDA